MNILIVGEKRLGDFADLFKLLAAAGVNNQEREPYNRGSRLTTEAASHITKTSSHITHIARYYGIRKEGLVIQFLDKKI